MYKLLRAGSTKENNNNNKKVGPISRTALWQGRDLRQYTILKKKKKKHLLGIINRVRQIWKGSKYVSPLAKKTAGKVTQYFTIYIHIYSLSFLLRRVKFLGQNLRKNHHLHAGGFGPDLGAVTPRP